MNHIIRQSFRIAQIADAPAIALLHQRTLTGSFLAKLGIGFLGSLYGFLIKKELVIVYTEGKVLKGFVAFSTNSSGIMKRFLFTCPVCVIKLIGILISSPALIKRTLETFAAPTKTSPTLTGKVILPDAELLSISVDPNCQKSGIGSQLLALLEDQLIQSGISKYKVATGVSLTSANNFYLRNNFVFASQVMIHGTELSNIYLKTLI